MLCGVLGALGRRFESCRPDSNNPSHREDSQPLFFIACLSHIAKGALKGALGLRTFYVLMRFTFSYPSVNDEYPYDYPVPFFDILRRL